MGQALLGMNRPNIEVFLCGPTPENFVGPVVKSQPGLVLIVDACDFGGVSGEWKVFPLSQAPEGLPMTHAFSLRFVAERIAESVNVPVRLVAIQPEDLSFGVCTSAAVRKGAEKLAREIGDGQLWKEDAP